MSDDDMRMERIARELRREEHIHPSLDDRVMDDVRRLPRHACGLWARLTTPRSITVTPLTWGLAAAALMAFAGLGVVSLTNEVEVAAAPIERVLLSAPDTTRAVQSVQFVLVAPDAKKVAVAGDFNGWDPSHAAYQAHHRGGGVWSVTAPVPPGHHRYSFVVDDSLWVADPYAPRAVDADFGVANSALVVQGQE